MDSHKNNNHHSHESTTLSSAKNPSKRNRIFMDILKQHQIVTPISLPPTPTVDQHQQPSLFSSFVYTLSESDVEEGNPFEGDQDHSGNIEDMDYFSMQEEEEEDEYESTDYSDEEFISSSFLEEMTDSEEEEFSSNAISEAEVLIKRRDKIKKLMKLYRGQFRRLRDILRAKHRKFIKLRQRGEEEKLFMTDIERERLRKKRRQLKSNMYVKNSKSVKELKQDLKNKKKALQMEEAKQMTCTFTGCKLLCMPLTNFCYAHILSDPNQKLFTSCKYVNRTTGNVCNYPILIAQTPQFCNVHIEIDSDTKEPKPRKRKATTGEDGTPETSKKQQGSTSKLVNVPVTSAYMQHRPVLATTNVQSPKVQKADKYDTSDQARVASQINRPVSPYGIGGSSSYFTPYNTYPVLLGSQGVQSIAQLQQQQLQMSRLQAQAASILRTAQPTFEEKKQ